MMNNQELKFLYLKVLKEEYKSLIVSLKQDISLTAEPIAIDLGQIKTELAKDDVPLIAELPIFLAPSILREEKEEEKYKIIGSIFRLSQDVGKIGLFFKSAGPEKSIKLLVCAGEDSIGTVLARLYAKANRWHTSFDTSDEVEVHEDYEDILDEMVKWLELEKNRNIPVGLEKVAWVLSGSRRETMVNLAEEQYSELKVINLYREVMNYLKRQGTMLTTDLPATLLIAKQNDIETKEDLFTKFIHKVDEWAYRDRENLKKMGCEPIYHEKHYPERAAVVDFVRNANISLSYYPWGKPLRYGDFHHFRPVQVFISPDMLFDEPIDYLEKRAQELGDEIGCLIRDGHTERMDIVRGYYEDLFPELLKKNSWLFDSKESLLCLKRNWKSEKLGLDQLWGDFDDIMRKANELIREIERSIEAARKDISQAYPVPIPHSPY